MRNPFTSNFARTRRSHSAAAPTVRQACWTKELDPRIERVALRKLAMLDAAETLNDLRVPPGNRLEAFRGDRVGQHSMRVSQQWRICFTWTDAGPQDVQIVDYHEEW